MSRVVASGPRVVHPVMAIRRLRGGSQSVLLMGSDGRNYITKFTGNPQGSQVLANEWIGTALARAAGLPVPPSVVVQVSKTFLERNPLIMFQLSDRVEWPQSGLHFGSQMIRGKFGDPPVVEYVPSSQRDRIENLTDFIGVALFDLILEVDDRRQVVFLPHPQRRTLKATFIDFGHLLQGPNWDSFRVAALSVHSSLAYYPDLWRSKRMLYWIAKFQKTFPGALRQAIAEMPSHWYAGDLRRKQDRLLERLELAPALIRSVTTAPTRVLPNHGQPSAAIARIV